VPNMGDAVPENRSDSLNVPWADTVRFVQQLSHDLRNHLNAIELQSAYISELDANPELKAEIKRLREMISRLTAVLQNLSRGVAEVKPDLMSYRASNLVEDLRKKVAHEFPNESAEITWDIETGDAMLQVDPQLLEQAFSEVFANAFQHDRGKGTLVAAARIDGKRFVFTLREPKTQFESSTENWGREPLRKITRGHYGLGLNRLRVIMEAHGGEMHAKYDPKDSTLLTTLSLPLAGGGN
jgi:K+-sensing histidine kinase KdpD